MRVDFDSRSFVVIYVQHEVTSGCKNMEIRGCILYYGIIKAIIQIQNKLYIHSFAI